VSRVRRSATRCRSSSARSRRAGRASRRRAPDRAHGLGGAGRGADRGRMAPARHGEALPLLHKPGPQAREGGGGVHARGVHPHAHGDDAPSLDRTRAERAHTRVLADVGEVLLVHARRQLRSGHIRMGRRVGEGRRHVPRVNGAARREHDLGAPGLPGHRLPARVDRGAARVVAACIHVGGAGQLVHDVHRAGHLTDHLGGVGRRGQRQHRCRQARRPGCHRAHDRVRRAAAPPGWGGSGRCNWPRRQAPHRATLTR